MTEKDKSNLMFLIGFVLLDVGAFYMWKPLGFMFLGLFIMFFGVARWWAADNEEKKDKKKKDSPASIFNSD